MDPVLQSLYDPLRAQGSSSVEDALRAAAFVEEVDIQDLVVRSGETSNQAISTV